MKKIVFRFLAACLFIQLLVLPLSAGIVTPDDARSVAENWVALKIGQQGSWGGSPDARIVEVLEFKHADRLIGYFCPVSPQGYIIVPLRRELAPVKAYSDTGNLDPGSDEGLAGLIKEQMGGTLDTIEKEAGPVESISSSSVTPLMEGNYLKSWEALESEPPEFRKNIHGMVALSNYQQGGILYSSCWTQRAPYYDQTPAPPSESTCTEPHCSVGCGPLAAGQVMRYWAWPPYNSDSAQPYDWPLMFNQSSLAGSRWVDEFGNPITKVSIDAVARLLHEIGTAAGADYCDGDCSTPTYFADYDGRDLLDTFEDHYRYSTEADDLSLFNYPDSHDWFTLIKNQINANRPVPYGIWSIKGNHVMVCDGWQEFELGGVPYYIYHMNYGGAVSTNTWYYLDKLPPGANLRQEGILVNIYPAQALSPLKDQTYPLESFPYRYIDQDATGNSATFSAGQYIQFLPGVTMTCKSGTGTAIRFESSASDITRLFSRGDTSKGVHITGGTMRLNPGGSVRLL